MSLIESWNLYFPEDEYTPLNGIVKLIENCKNEINKYINKTNSINNINEQFKEKKKNIYLKEININLEDINRNPIIYFSLFTLYNIIPSDILFKNIDTSLNCISSAISDILFNNKYELKKIYLRILTYEENINFQDYSTNLISILNNCKIEKFSTICAEKIENLIFFKGTVVRVGSKKIKIVKPVYKCFKCKKLKVSKENIIKEMDKSVELNNETKNSFKIDEICLCINKQSHFIKNDILDLESSEIRDYQEIKIQEPDTANPNLIEVILFDELVGSISPGDVVSISGSIKAESDNSIMYKLIIHANNLVKINIHKTELIESNSINTNDYKIFEKLSQDKNIMKIFSKILFPNIIGHQHILFTLILSLFGGSKKFYGSSVSRSDIHILLIGDPGLGKSRILIDLINIIPKSIYVCGTMTTTAGLTVSLTHEDGDFIAEAGALILSNNGICCIDEFDKMQGASKSILEVMEEQVVSIAKGGVICNIPTKCSIIAASNPKFGRFKEMCGNSKNIIKETLKIERNVISRFDCVFLMKDSEDNMKRNLIKKIKDDALKFTKSFVEPKMIEKDEIEKIRMKLKTEINNKEDLIPPKCNENQIIDSDEEFEEFLKDFNEKDDTLEILQSLRDDIIIEDESYNNLYSKKILVKYILYARSINPIMTEEAKNYIQEYFNKILKNSELSTDPFYKPTLRTLETLLRLSESVSKVKLKSKVSLEDSEFAINLFKKSLLGSIENKFNSNELKQPFLKKKSFYEILKNKNKKEFTLKEIKNIFETEKFNEKHCFYSLINQLNEKGFLIKISNNSYKFI